MTGAAPTLGIAPSLVNFCGALAAVDVSAVVGLAGLLTGCDWRSMSGL